MKPDLRKFPVVWDCPADCRPLSLPPHVDSVPLIIVLTENSSSNYQNALWDIPPHWEPLLSAMNALICLFCSCFICSLSLLYALMLWATPRTETTAVPRCLARVAFLGWGPAAVVLHVIKGPLSHLLVHPPFQNSGPEWIERMRSRGSITCHTEIKQYIVP